MKIGLELEVALLNTIKYYTIMISDSGLDLNVFYSLFLGQNSEASI